MMKKNGFKWFSGFSLQKKLMFVFTMLTLGVMITFLVVTYWTVENSNWKQIRYSAEKSFDQAHAIIQKTVWPVLYAADMIHNNKNVQSIIIQEPENVPLAQQYRDMTNLQNILRNTTNAEELEQIRLYVDDDWMYAHQNVYFSSLEDLDSDMVLDGTENYYWMPPENMVLHLNEASTRVVSLLRRLTDSNNYKKTIGFVRVSIAAEELDNILYRANITQEGIVYLVNEKDQLIGCSNYDRAEEYGFTDASDGQIPVCTEEEWGNLSLCGKKYLAKSQQVDRTDWKMVALIPVSELNQSARKIGSVMVAVSVVILAVAFICIRRFSRWFTRRLYILSRGMISVREGNLDVPLETDEDDEIGMLYDSFQYMLGKMREYTKQQYENGKQLKNAELKVMQAQINPHFLYNTLDLINWEAMKYNVPEIAQITRSLARFYKLGLKKGKDIVSIESELQHVQEYVRIQNYRFNDKINLVLNVPEEVRELKILKITLQPLVENSILHGILESKNEREGMICINAKKTDDILILEIEDDGIGMTEAQVEHILQEKEESSGGYGIININMRLKLYYGDEYGLHYESRIGVGTKVTIRIPVQE